MQKKREKYHDLNTLMFVLYHTESVPQNEIFDVGFQN